VPAACRAAQYGAAANERCCRLLVRQRPLVCARVFAHSHTTNSLECRVQPKSLGLFKQGGRCAHRGAAGAAGRAAGERGACSRDGDNARNKQQAPSAPVIARACQSRLSTPPETQRAPTVVAMVAALSSRAAQVSVPAPIGAHHEVVSHAHLFLAFAAGLCGPGPPPGALHPSPVPGAGPAAADRFRAGGA
jgi:hypothetical protein